MQTFDKIFRVFWIGGIVTAMAILRVFPNRAYISFTIIWVLITVAFSRRRVLFRNILKQSSDMQEFGTFIGWFVLVMIGAGVASMWFFDGWQFGKPFPAH